MRSSCVALLTASPAASSAYRSILPALQRLPATAGFSRHHSRRHRHGGYRPASAGLADNMLSGLRNAFGGQTGAAAAAAHPFLDNAPSWEELSAMVEAQQRALNATPADLETVRCVCALIVCLGPDQ